MQDPITIDAEFVCETAKAICVNYEHIEEWWLPKSMISYESDAERGRFIWVDIPTWLAGKQEIYF